jgi:2-polyprenyl-3-methyl-5-hydroxy-6-metoxy-1,4-benzoquinol methylase
MRARARARGMFVTTADMKQLVVQGYDRIADRYLERYGGSAVRTRKLAELCDGLPPGARVLDLGCGAGVPVVQHFARGFAVTGVDASAAQIEQRRATCRRHSSSRPT